MSIHYSKKTFESRLKNIEYYSLIYKKKIDCLGAEALTLIIPFLLAKNQQSVSSLHQNWAKWR